MKLILQSCARFLSQDEFPLLFNKTVRALSKKTGCWYPIPDVIVVAADMSSYFFLSFSDAAISI